MARFPLKEAEVAALASMVAAGLTENPTIYPAPPVEAGQLTAENDAFIAARSDVVAAKAAWEEALVAKDATLETLKDSIKSDLRYAENTVRFDDAKLKLIGWGAKQQPAPLIAPGQTVLLTVPLQGDGSLSLAWKPPVDGGNVAAYQVMRRPRAEGTWQDVATAVIPEATLTAQPKSVELEYQIIAVNKAGQGPPSNTQMVVL